MAGGMVGIGSDFFWGLLALVLIALDSASSADLRLVEPSVGKRYGCDIVDVCWLYALDVDL